MPDEYLEGNRSDQEFEDSINPRDTYGARFQVKSRIVGSRAPRSAVIAGKKHIKNSEKIFSKRHDREDRGGSVNIKNINISKETKLVDSEKKEKSSSDLRSSGLDSLFSSTTGESEKTVTKSSKEVTGKISAKKKSFSVESSQTASRKLKVIKPVSYNSAASEISTALKSGAAVVLCLKNTAEETSKRLLDFSFGAASICGAQVSIEADRTYALTIGAGLSQREKLLCVKEGVALKVEN